MTKNRFHTISPLWQNQEYKAIFTGNYKKLYIYNVQCLRRASTLKMREKDAKELKAGREKAAPFCIQGASNGAAAASSLSLAMLSQTPRRMWPWQLFP